MDVKPRVMESPVGPRVRIDGREVDYFCGTSYFGLHGHPDVIEAACTATREYGLGTATAIQTPAHRDLEAQLSRFLGVESVVHLASGYLAPLVLVQALAKDCDLALVDSAAHYGAWDALRSIGAPVFTFRHLDPEDLERQLAARTAQARVLVMTDGVFPTTGAIAPLRDYLGVLHRASDALLCVDDAHGLGVLGANGRGSLDHHGLALDTARVCGTLSKAFGGSGGVVAGEQSLKDKMRELSPGLRGASAPSVPAAAASAAGVRILSTHPEMRHTLWSNVRRARDGLRGLGFDLDASPVPIISLQGRAGLDLRRAHAELTQAGIAVLYVPPRGYSDAPDVESLRIAVFSTHSHEQIDRLVGAVRRAL